MFRSVVGASCRGNRVGIELQAAVSRFRSWWRPLQNVRMRNWTMLAKAHDVPVMSPEPLMQIFVVRRLSPGWLSAASRLKLSRRDQRLSNEAESATRGRRWPPAGMVGCRLTPAHLYLTAEELRPLRGSTCRWLRDGNRSRRTDC